MKVQESSGYTFEGSITPDLILSKIWLASELLKLNQEFSTVYILGSWYGNMAYILNKMNVPIQKIINVDINEDWLKFGRDLLNYAGYTNVESMNKDANALNYRQLNSNSIVINTSETDIPGKNWFRNIPPGTLVAIQSRDMADNQRYTNVEQFNKAYPMSKTLYLNVLNLTDPETDYQRFMKIGIK